MEEEEWNKNIKEMRGWGSKTKKGRNKNERWERKWNRNEIRWNYKQGRNRNEIDHSG